MYNITCLFTLVTVDVKTADAVALKPNYIHRNIHRHHILLIFTPSTLFDLQYLENAVNTLEVILRV